MAILHVLLTDSFPDSTLRDCIRTQNTCFWRVSEENLRTCTHVRVWAMPEVNSSFSEGLCVYTAPITGWSSVPLRDGMDRIIHIATATPGCRSTPPAATSPAR